MSDRPETIEDLVRRERRLEREWHQGALYGAAQLAAEGGAGLDDIRAMACYIDEERLSLSLRLARLRGRDSTG
jgi:hypothetical protein